MMPEQVRCSLVEVIRTLRDANLHCNNAFIQAPGADRYGLDFLGDLTNFTAIQTQRVLDQAAENATWDAALPALTPDLSKNLGERIKVRRESIARDAIVRQWLESRAQRPAPTPRFH